jgi:DNA mismatch endonuclease (patch repair protein)
MKRVKQKDSSAELALRSALHQSGLRFRLHRKVEGIVVDIVFVAAKVAVFVDGCFWHSCPIHATSPKTNQSYWLPKLAENKKRDQRQTDKLRAAGWDVIRTWEHDCLPPSRKVVQLVGKTVRRRSSRTGDSIHAR